MCLKGLSKQFSSGELLLLLLICTLIIGGVNIIDQITDDAITAGNYFTKSMLLLVPAFYIPFNFKLVSEYFNKNGGELLQMYHPNVMDWLLTFLLLYSLCIIPGFVFAAIRLDISLENILIYYFAIIICCLLFLVITHAISFITRSAIIAMIFVCAYFIFCVLGYEPNCWWNFLYSRHNKLAFLQYSLS